MTLTEQINKTQAALTAARAAGDKRAAADLLGKLCTLRNAARASQDRHPSQVTRLSPFATPEQTNEFHNQRQAQAEEAADTPILGFAPRPFHDIEAAYRAGRTSADIVSLDTYRRRTQ